MTHHAFTFPAAIVGPGIPPFDNGIVAGGRHYGRPLTLADQALYRVKRAGRDRSETYVTSVAG